MMPKSTAPMDSKLAERPRANSMKNANNKASGMLIATMSALRTLPKNMSRITVTSTMPKTRLCDTVPVVAPIKCLRS